MNDKVVTIKKGPKIGFVLWLVIFIVLLLGALYQIVGQSTIRQVVVIGSSHYSREEVKAMVGITEDTTVLDVFMHRNTSYDHLPYIKEVEISYLSFNSIQIEVEEKEVISYIPYQGRYLALDNDGYIVGYENEKVMDLPSVKGLYFDSASLGEQLDVREQVLAAMLDLYHLGNKYKVQLSEIDFVQGDEAMIHLYVNDVRIIIGEAVDLDRKMRAAGEVIQRLDSEVKGSLDLQVAGDHYIFKEESEAMRYVAYGERYIGIDSAYMVRKITIHRMKDQLLVTGLKIEHVVEQELLEVDPAAIQTIEAVEWASEEVGLVIDVIGFNESNHDKYDLYLGDIILKMKGTEALEEKLSEARNLIYELEVLVAGTIDLRGEVGEAVFEAEKVE